MAAGQIEVVGDVRSATGGRAVLIARLQFSQIRGRQPNLFVRKIPYVIASVWRLCGQAHRHARRLSE